MENFIVSITNWFKEIQFSPFQELISTIIQTLMVAPIVTFLVGLQQKRRDRRERLQMIDPIIGGTKPITESIKLFVMGPDVDMFNAGLEMYARAFENKRRDSLNEKTLHFYLGNTLHLIITLKNRISSECAMLDGLIDLFAPHFRTNDSLLIQDLRTNTRELEERIIEIYQKAQYLNGSAKSVASYLNELLDNQNKPDIDAQVKLTQADLISQIIASQVNQSREIITLYEKLSIYSNLLPMIVFRIVEEFFDNKKSFPEILEYMKKQRWYKKLNRENASIRTNTSSSGPLKEEEMKKNSNTNSKIVVEEDSEPKPNDQYFEAEKT